MTYEQTIRFLFDSLPMYQRIGNDAVKKDLTNIRLLAATLGQPQEKFPSIHIAGTNGKGSTSHMLASIFQAAGYRTGLYTSPHYVDFRERIRINGAMISKREVIRFVEKYRPSWDEIRPSFFEITVAMAFDHFQRHKVDIAIIETGLGGRLDSTNIILPKLSIITNIGFDHMVMLGNTLEAIAGEKAGIIKPGIPVVIGEWDKQTAPVFQKAAQHWHAPLSFASRKVKVRMISNSILAQNVNVTLGGKEWFGRLSCDLTGPYQIKNIGTVLQAMHIWNQTYPERMIRDKAIREGLRHVRTSTGMIGRWMKLNEKPLVLTDAAHNGHGMDIILPALKTIPAEHRHFVLGFVSDKEISSILKLFPVKAKYYWCAPAIPRARAAIETKEIGDILDLKGDAFGSVVQAYRAALSSAGDRDLIFVGGSSYVVGDLLASLQR